MIYLVFILIFLSFLLGITMNNKIKWSLFLRRFGITTEEKIMKLHKQIQTMNIARSNFALYKTRK